jgi:hypothetical protein
VQPLLLLFWEVSKRLGARFARILRLLLRLLLRLAHAGLWLIVIAFGIGLFLMTTPRDQPYRNLSPYNAFCERGLVEGWPDLADPSLADPELIDDTEEEALLRQRPGFRWHLKLQCALQRHIIPATGTHQPIDYYLGFLEFDEAGVNFALTLGNAGSRPGASELANARDCEHLDNQLDVLKAFLAPSRLQGRCDAPCENPCYAWRCGAQRRPNNYVVVFVHGWRHNAAIGDADVGHLRRYAALAARFLAQRCEQERSDRYCNTKVTGIYVGWRGARVDEQYLKRQWWHAVGVPLGSFAAGATLFDRKPVSEQVAPGVISALRTLEEQLGIRVPYFIKPSIVNGKGTIDQQRVAAQIERTRRANRNNRMMVFGHSLGGNLLITGLRDDLMKAVRRHRPGDLMPPILGDLVVLINPAAEAGKWTEVQREVWSRTPYYANTVTPWTEVEQSYRFFSEDQGPIILSVTSALKFPAGEFRDSDRLWLERTAPSAWDSDRKSINAQRRKAESIWNRDVQYDWATHDLFPAFRFDLRPLAETIDRSAERTTGADSAQSSEDGRGTAKAHGRVVAALLHWVADSMRNFPFQNTDQELTRTIGNLDPPRPADGLLNFKKDMSAAPFGTTHELTGLGGNQGRPATGSTTCAVPDDAELPLYRRLADVPIDCPPANHWLTLALDFEDKILHSANSLNWDSLCLCPAPNRAAGEGPPRGHFLHGFNLGGTAATTRATDPFWNIRAFDDILARHDGYRFSSFICAMNQFVMDDITIASGPTAEHRRASRERCDKSNCICSVKPEHCPR